ncbi:MAG: hypothetical protein H7Y42_17910 [Chitinophagaceae bacterium]|nr:hypothetical protein [Chitinophagaceae bacterium]
MSLLIQYLVKLSISLGIVWLFYQFVLRRLTFYNSNRWYLVTYTLLSFLIPFINITPVLQRNEAGRNDIVQMIPSVHQYTIAMEEASHCPIPIWSTNYDKWDWMAFALMAGAAFFLIRFLIRFISFFRMKKKARLVSGDGMRLYEVNDNIIPFSFGNSVFINSALHTEAELQEIISHEFVHVKQRHTLDIIWSEWLCIINWYNPFAWLIKRSIRQNLEFIADNKVLENGVDKRQYQYLLLKVIGNNQYSIASKFNFSSLKKRIAMMNKLKTTRLHLVKFLFVLPMLAVMLISFRKQIVDKFNQSASTVVQPAFTDSVPPQIVPNDKGYYIDIHNKNGECIVVVKDVQKKEVARLPLTAWNEKEDYYTGLYGEISPPLAPTSPLAPTAPTLALDMDEAGVKAFMKRNPSIKNISWEHVQQDNYRLVQLRILKTDGTIETYPMRDEADHARIEKKYGKFPAAPVPPTPPVPPVAPTAPTPAIDGEDEGNVTRVFQGNRTKVAEFEVTEKKAVMKMKDGTTEQYDLTNAGERNKFESKYGRVVSVGSNVHGALAPGAAVHAGTGVGSGEGTPQATPRIASVGTGVGEGIGEGIGVAVLAPTRAVGAKGVAVVDNNGHVITGEEDIVVTITKNTTIQQLEEIKKQMKAKGVELTFDKTEFQKGVLLHISGSMTLGDSKSIFSATEFRKLVLAMIKDGERIYFKVNSSDENEEI